MVKNEVQSPLMTMHEWIEKEKALGSANPYRIVLATCSPEGAPRSRIVAIKQITAEGILFFTQHNSRKVTELAQNPHASMTLWLALQQRQVVLEGMVKPLTDQENERFWTALPRDKQLHFSAYAPTSGQPIDSLSVLEERLEVLKNRFHGSELPLSRDYCGFHLIVDTSVLDKKPPHNM